MGRAVAATLLTESELERDRRLVEAHQAGDASAFGELYQLHFERLVRFCQRKVRDSHLAEEIAQESFLKAYRALTGLEGGRRFYPWLTVIASRLVIDHHRRASRVAPSASVDPGSVDDVHEDLDRQVDREQILLALQRVRVRHREVLHLRDYEDLSYEAIAQRLGTSPTVVQSLLHRARAALRREYLAMTEHSALAPVLAPVLALLRRMRHRAGKVVAWLPDPSALGAPLTAAALVVTGALTGAPAALPSASPAADQLPAHAVEGAMEPLTAEPTDVTVPAQAAAPPSAKPPAGAPPPAQVWLGAEGAQQARAQGQDMPTRVDSAVGMVAADPSTIIDDTIAAATGLLGGN